jgi:hypothetical protein
MFFNPALVAALATCIVPFAAHARLPLNAVTPSTEWLLGGWVTEGAKCAELATVYLPGGRLGNVTSANTILVLGQYDLRGKVLTSKVFDDRYDLTNVTWVGGVGQNLLVSSVPNNTDPNISIPPKRRCPNGAGFEPWFPKIRFKGISAYRIVTK